MESPWDVTMETPPSSASFKHGKPGIPCKETYGFNGRIIYVNDVMITGWWFGTSNLFSHLLGIIIPID